MLNYQTMIIDLTGLEIANASIGRRNCCGRSYGHVSQKPETLKQPNFFWYQEVFPQTLDILYTRAEPLNIEIVGSWRL